MDDRRVDEENSSKVAVAVAVKEAATAAAVVAPAVGFAA